MSDDKVMSQAEIDALVAKVPVKPSAPKPAQAIAPKPPPSPTAKPPVNEKPAAPSTKAAVAEKPTAPPSKPAAAEKPAAVPPAPPAAPPPALKEGEPKYEKYSSGEVGNLQSVVADLARQVGKMTNAMQKLDSMEEKVNIICSLLKLDPDDTQSIGARLDEIYARLDAMQKASIQHSFTCGHCKSGQMMAVHVKCTTCGEETWMGWWPEGNHK